MNLLRRTIKALAIICLVVTSSCKTLDFASMKPADLPIETKLLGINLVEDDNLGVDEIQIVEEELSTNISSEYGSRYGFLKVKHTNLDIKAGAGYMWVGAFLGFIPNIFGFPLMAPSVETDLVFEIYNSKNELIGKYNGHGSGKSVIALYHGYTMQDAPRKAVMDAVLSALPEIREKIAKDASRLNGELEKSGKIKS